MPVLKRKDCAETYRHLGIRPMSFDDLVRLRQEWALRHGPAGSAAIDQARLYVAEMLIEGAGGSLKDLLETAQDLQNDCGVDITVEGNWFGHQALFAAGDWYAHGRKRGMGAVPILTNPQAAHKAAPSFLDVGIQRAVAAGAKPPLTFLGIGGFGIVFCDDDQYAWKVDYSPHDEIAEYQRTWPGCSSSQMADEFEFLQAAGQVPEISANIVPVHSWDAENLAMKRECIWGAQGRWGDGKELMALHKKIAEAMEPLGWSAPEYKEDSYVMPHDESRWVLVDGGLAHRLGRTLARYVESVLDGRRPRCSRWRDLAFYVQREVGQPGGLRYGEAEKLVSRILPHLTDPVDIHDVSNWLHVAEKR